MAMAMALALERAAMDDPDLMARVRRLRQEVPARLGPVEARRVASLARHAGEVALEVRRKRMEAQEEVACRLRQLQGELADMGDAPELPGSTSAQLARVQQELATLATRLGPAPPPQDLQDPFPSGSHTLEGVLPQALQAARTRGEGISVLRIGLDHFPWVIDEAGPIGAEEVIRSVALRTAGILREKDLVIRTGLSDFAVVLPGTSLSAARQVAERVLKGVGRLRFTHAGSRVGVTCTVVVAQVAPQEAVDDLVGRLSSAVSEAGRDGENQVVAA